MEFKNYEEEKRYYETEATEEQFLEWYKKQDLPTYEKPSVPIDNVMFQYVKETDNVQLLLIKRKAHPFKDHYALTGGFSESTESLRQTCIRETVEETGIKITEENIEQLATFSEPNRDPRGWVISQAYMVFLPQETTAIAGDDALEVEWFNVSTDLEQNIYLVGTKSGKGTVIHANGQVKGDFNLAFDHSEIIKTAVDRIRYKITMHYDLKFLEMLGDDFTTVEARKVISKFIGVKHTEIDNSNFRKVYGFLFEETGEFRKDSVNKGGRPSKVYRLRNENTPLDLIKQK